MTYAETPLFRRFVRWTAIAATFATVAGCSTAPLSFLNDRQVFYRAQLNRFPVFVVAVDGVSTTFHPQPITAGNHLVTFDAQPVGGLTQPVQKTFAMAIEPCTRYYVAAQRTSPLVQDWNLVVEEKWQVGGCDPQRELEKARQAAARGEQPQLSSVIEAAPLPLSTASAVRSPTTH